MRTKSLHALVAAIVIIAATVAVSGCTGSKDAPPQTPEQQQQRADKKGD